MSDDEIISTDVGTGPMVPRLMRSEAFELLHTPVSPQYPNYLAHPHWSVDRMTAFCAFFRRRRDFIFLAPASVPVSVG